MTKQCPECNSDQKYSYNETVDGSFTRGFWCGAVTNEYISGKENIRKKCDDAWKRTEKQESL